MLTFTVEDQEITRTDTEKVIAGSVNYVQAVFTFDEAWSGLTITAYFQIGSIRRAVMDVKSGVAVTVPWEVLRPGNLHVYVEGYDGTVRLTAARMRRPVRIFASGRGHCSEPAGVPSKDVYEQLLDAFQASKELVQEVYDDAQSGNLDGKGLEFLWDGTCLGVRKEGQQDYLLPFVEDGTLVLIGATTENPYFEVNGALLSRSIIFELKSLEKKDIRKLLDRAVTDPVKGLGSYHAEVSEEALDFLADLAGGDARAALNAIELGVLTTERSADGKIHVDLETAQECIQKRVVRYDKTGDQHYDTISAFIKSMRGSDPDAAVYYLAKMLYAGEDIKFIARRIMICAAEDVGMADPQALVVATAAAQAVERIGMPEAQIILSEAVTYVATAPKSNTACEAVFAAMASVKKKKTSVPAHLQDAHYKGSSKLGHGVGYLYAHDYPEHYVKQQYLPDEIKEEVFYHPTDIGYEKQAGERLRHLREREE